MLTVGVDVAAEPVNTAAAWLDWAPGTCSVRRLVIGVDDALIIDLLITADKAGIDCPLGWPAPFVEFVMAHQAGHVNVPVDITGRAWRRILALRLTDRQVYERTGLTPLSVSADRIAHAAMRCAAISARSHARVGQWTAAAAALSSRFILRHRSNCGGCLTEATNVHRTSRTLDAWSTNFRRRHPGSTWERTKSVCRRHHDALDAVIAALTARAAFRGLATTPDAEHVDTAMVEGWIALPTTPLHDLRP